MLRFIKNYIYKHPIFSTVSTYLIISSISILLDLLRKIELPGTDFWFIIKLVVLSIILICFMNCIIEPLHNDKLKSTRCIALLSVFITFIIAKLVLIIFVFSKQSTGYYNLYNILFNFIWAVGIGVTEEVLCRGILLNILLKGGYKSHKTVSFAVFVSSLVFSLGHISNLFYGSSILSVCVQTFFSFFIGACFALIYLYSGSVVLVIALHSIYDFVGFIINEIGFALPHFSVLYFLINIVFIIIVAVLVCLNLNYLRNRELDSSVCMSA